MLPVRVWVSLASTSIAFYQEAHLEALKITAESFVQEMLSKTQTHWSCASLLSWAFNCLQSRGSLHHVLLNTGAHFVRSWWSLSSEYLDRTTAAGHTQCVVRENCSGYDS